MSKQKTFELSVIHFSDFHARFVPFLSHDKKTKVGGIARVSTIIKKLKQQRSNAILLNAGDFFNGTLYYALFQESITAHFMNLLPHDAITIGNHDFASKISGLESFVKKLEAPVVVANVDVSEEPSLQNLWTSSTVIRRGNKDVGVIGVIFSDTDKIAVGTGKLKFLEESKAVNLEARKLKAEGINIIIVLSHCGIERDVALANNCPDIDIIVGGHSHVLLYNGDPPSSETVWGEYPTVVTQKETNKTVLIAHASALTKYLGDLQLTFDENDKVLCWQGNPIYLDESIEEDPLIVEELIPWKMKVDRIGNQVIGETLIDLNGSYGLPPNESTLNNVVTDAMIHTYFSDASLSLMPVNVIRHNIPIGPILYEDAFMMLPRNNTWDLIELRGSDIVQIVEENLIGKAKEATFVNLRPLHWSGMRVIYNRKDKQHKVIKVEVRYISNYKDNEFELINKDQWYKVVVPDFMLSPHTDPISKKYRNRIVSKSSDLENLVNYIKATKVIKLKKEARVTFVD
ncbi:apyrase-like isoform X2 [Phymastichus coffea]|uniref:apyrase-like isoform X2 n=1 Tax=Phymastichus coffea TaxID=108790 RepID=UPI00273C6D17|nr:apyrase-like isoform X2 [Phymastichus coffea]